MRIPLAAQLESRDGTLAKDALVSNALVEVRGDKTFLRMRPQAYQVYGGSTLIPGGQLIASWYGFHAIYGDTINSYPTFASAVGSSTEILTTDAESERMSHAVTGSGVATPLMMFKNSTNAWTMDKGYNVSAVTYGATMGAETYNAVSVSRSGSTVTVTVQGDTVLHVGQEVTIAGATPTDYNGVKAVTSVTAASVIPEREVPITITRSGTTATATSTVVHGLTTGTAYTISGANQAEYNGSKTITVTSPTTFTFTVTVTAMDSPATGSPVLSEQSLFVAGNNYAGSDRTVFVVGFSGVLAWVGLVVGSTVRTTSPAMTGTVTAISGGYITFTVAGITTFISVSGNLYITPPAVSSITYSGVTATLTTATPHNISGTTPSFTVSGADQSGYNGTYTMNVTGPSTLTYTITPVDDPVTPATGTIIVTSPLTVGQSSFTYEIAGTPSTPATGTITIAVDGGTVPGIVYLNGYFVVMDVNGFIYNSAQDDPTTWGALDFLAAQKEDGQGVALAKSRDYIVALKEWSTELFYDAGNATGSPFSPVDTGFERVGCANGWSVAGIDDAVIFVGQSRASGRGVWLRDGLNSAKISTPDIDRVLAEDNLATVYAFAFKPGGRAVYVLSLPDSDITLVCDLESKMWGEWSANDTTAVTVNVDSITRDGDWATVDCATAHFLTDGDPVVLVGANQTEYNGTHLACVIDSTTYRFKVAGEPVTPATGTITSATLSGDGYLRYAFHVNHEGLDCLQHATNGIRIGVMTFDPAAYPLEVAPAFKMRTVPLDGGTLDLKKLASLKLVATKTDGHAFVRWSDDDGATWSKFRPLDLSDMEPEVRRCGSFRRRQFEVRYIGKRPPIIEALELRTA